MSSFSCGIIGNESLVIQCGDILRARGHAIAVVVTRNPEVRAWATGHGLPVVEAGAGLAERLGPVGFDWLFSIANLSIVPEAVIARAAKGAINFHDGPLPRYAGLNAPVWAILNREPHHGVTWHMIEGGIDEGDIVEQRTFEIAPDETALTLNTRCYAAAIDSFAALVASIEAGGPARAPQDLAQRSYFARDARPARRRPARLPAGRRGSGRACPGAGPRRLLEPARPPQDRLRRPHPARGRGRRDRTGRRPGARQRPRGLRGARWWWPPAPPPWRSSA